MFTQTKNFLAEFDNSHDFERMCADILIEDDSEYKDVTLRAPGGGPDGGRDIEFKTKDGKSGLACVTLRKDIKTKYYEDFGQRRPRDYDFYIFLCTAVITHKHKDEFTEHCKTKLKAEDLRLIDGETMRSLLDTKCIQTRKTWFNNYGLIPQEVPINLKKWQVRMAEYDKIMAISSARLDYIGVLEAIRRSGSELGYEYLMERKKSLDSEESKFDENRSVRYLAINDYNGDTLLHYNKMAADFKIYIDKNIKFIE